MEGKAALRDLRRAADLGNALANFVIGAGILEGKITHKDPARACRRLLVAAVAGMPEAQYLLSGILFTGVPSGVLPNRAEAVKWALLCKGMNSEFSRKLLKDTLESSSPGDIEEGRKRAAEFQPKSRDKTMGRKIGFRYHRPPARRRRRLVIPSESLSPFGRLSEAKLGLTPRFALPARRFALFCRAPMRGGSVVDFFSIRGKMGTDE